ncbi:lipid II:glycine glycyltransferase FemX [Sphaerochaeta sp. PS]|uniref:lipid II:glycine glycyltransferase FemX n=1 Tax=Sphaerochaeta sp. PS TaxID=3076336 RepID=UPI0028A3EEC0|nr:peptidoglycan bridge formation glycyltransferase FemA/FemB family protein [Sphaerochaeta sp. PS]MDT4762887.1 peptidoglycan bridge formation glycyltransferase FemA/FemB family protein [Sphaerochaeta sp. PS]
MVLVPLDYKKIPSTGSPFQSSYWAAVKHGSGWKPYAFSIELDGWVSSILVLVKPLLPLSSLAYVPFGPDVFNNPLPTVSEFLTLLSKELKKALPKGVFSIRYDLPWDEVDDPNVMWLSCGRFRPTKESVQPDGTVRISLEWGYHAVTLGYRDRAKRALRKSSSMYKVEVWDGGVPSFKRWYETYLETARRDGFSPRSEKYLKALLALDGKVYGDVRCKLVLARDNKVIVGGLILLLTSKEAVYLYGSTLRQDATSCAYVLQDFAIRLACEHGCTIYDLHGIPGPKGRGQHLAGLELFKLSFGGQSYYRSPTTDYVLHFLQWKLYTVTEYFRYRMIRKNKPQEGVLPSS